MASPSGEMWRAVSLAMAQRLWLTTSTMLCPSVVQDEGAVVARVVDGALAGTPVVLVARGERGGVERAHGHVVLRREGDVDVLRKRPLVVDEREAGVGALELHVVRLVHAQLQPGVRGDRRVEALGRGEVTDADPEVVDAAVGHRLVAFRVHRLRAVAVRVEQEPAVVVGPVDRAPPRRAVVAYPASIRAVAIALLAPSHARHQTASRAPEAVVR